MLEVIRQKTRSFAVGEDSFGNIQTRPQDSHLTVTFKETHGYVEVGMAPDTSVIEYRDGRTSRDLCALLVEELEERMKPSDRSELSSGKSAQILVLPLAY